MDLKELQASVDRWIQTHGGYWDKFQILARLTEELGEVSAALQRQEGLRPRKVEVDVGAEIGDLLFVLASLANVENIDLEECLRKTLEKYDIRDGEVWKRRTGP